MNLQKKLDLIEQYRNSINFFNHPKTGIEYTIMPDPKIKFGLVKIEVHYGRNNKTNS